MTSKKRYKRYSKKSQEHYEAIARSIRSFQPLPFRNRKHFKKGQKSFLSKLHNQLLYNRNKSFISIKKKRSESKWNYKQRVNSIKKKYGAKTGINGVFLNVPEKLNLKLKGKIIVPKNKWLKSHDTLYTKVIYPFSFNERAIMLNIQGHRARNNMMNKLIDKFSPEKYFPNMLIDSFTINYLYGTGETEAISIKKKERRKMTKKFIQKTLRKMKQYIKKKMGKKNNLINGLIFTYKVYI